MYYHARLAIQQERKTGRSKSSGRAGQSRSEASQGTMLPSPDFPLGRMAKIALAVHDSHFSTGFLAIQQL
ncbi:hypothetical protein [Melghirimyces algeriensis]|uniref:hypothetical protein n=1 Tax=Melghirimyces algeriensis TaxID=910412 RepID=UPI0011599A0C|nr:hypothetical protein [Melghirimyces algeriensis]